ncbi:MAG: histidine phosphatase family protein, partial [Actinobacteria bacterium]|nr:histidine phosphatase family protein [Actinomycetota bacterium]
GELKSLMKLPEWNNVQRAPSTFTFPGGESFTAMQNRIIGTIDRLRTAHPGGVVVCVSHADPIKAAVAHALGTHIDLFQRIVISTCSVTAIAYGGGAPVVLTVNSTGGSLAELRPS